MTAARATLPELRHLGKRSQVGSRRRKRRGDLQLDRNSQTERIWSAKPAAP